MAEEEKDKKEEEKQEAKEGMFDETTSYSFLFFLVSGGLLLVTLWSFWDDEYSRRGFKAHQEEYFRAEYKRAEQDFQKVNKDIAAKAAELEAEIQKETETLDGSDEFQNLADDALVAQVNLEDVEMDQKFAKSRLDQAYYFYKKAMHENKNYDVQLEHMHAIEKEIEDFEPVLAGLRKKRDDLEGQLLEKKARKDTLEKDLKKLISEKIDVETRMDFYKPFPFFYKTAAVEQTVIPGAGLNNFKEIIYKVDRCQTCHIAYENSNYKDYEHPLKTHPNKEILIDKHPPTKTGCTWCHKGQGSATAPAEHAHGSHHEMDQTTGINEPILLGSQMQSNCTNCHAEVVNLEGAPILSKGKELFIKLGCHGCHLVDGYQNERKVGPRLNRIASKVSASWLFRWVKKPKDYLPKTRMPIFNLDDKDSMAITAYLMAFSEKDYQLPVKFEEGDADNGKKLFESVGCLGCHELNGKGHAFGPELGRIGNKVSADWLVSWLSNPKHYNNQSIMPDLRLTEEQASDLTAYLIQFGKPKPIHGIDQMITDPDIIADGEVLVRRRGCFACHDIKGMEKEGRIAPELSAFGAKQVRELEFGDTHIPHTWESWTRNKLKNPDSYRTERILDKMPNFELADDEIDALVVLLKGLNGTIIPEPYRYILSEKEEALENGRRLASKYNCKGCHVLEGEGGFIREYLKGKHLYPPPLDMGPYHVGERIKGSWLFSFLKNPTPVRKWVKVKMPTFFLTDSEVRDFTAYFEALSKEDRPYEEGINIKKNQESIEMGVKIVNTMDCGKCHDEGAKGVEFSIAGERLKQTWIANWLKNTRDLIPWTKMPNHWPKSEDGTFTIPTKFSILKDVEGGNIDKHIAAISDFLVSYNTAEYDPSLSFMSSDGGDEGDEEEEDEEEEDEDE